MLEKKEKIRQTMDVAQWHKACLASTRPWDRLLSLKQVYLLHFKKNVWESGENRTMAVAGGQRTARSHQFSPSAMWILKWNWGCQAWHQAPAPTEPSHESRSPSFKNKVLYGKLQKAWTLQSVEKAGHVNYFPPPCRS